MSRYIYLITEDELEQVKKDCNWENKDVVIPSPEEDITTHKVSLEPSSLGDTVAMWPPPPDEEETPKPTKEKKRKRASPANSPKPKKRKARKTRADFAALSTEVAQNLRDDKEEGEYNDYLLVVRKRRSTGASKSAEQAQQKGELVEQLREELKVKEAETLGWKQHMDRFASRKDTLWDQPTSIEHQLQNSKEESLARIRKIEKLEAKSAAELAKAKSEAEAFVSLRQPQRETFQEVHTRGFDLSVDIEKAKTLDDEATALLSDDEDSSSGSKSGGDEHEAPKEEVPEDTAPEDAAPEDMASKDVVPEDVAPQIE
ncbi:uncharacterized protein [Nicotiana sylvestris]|uniref:uncharacterized protein n=1 Tax=Nicotiana sylvestris TaxID=4096 RepID=UPI00388C513D